MTNPSQTAGTNAGYNGRTTPNAMNDVLQLFDTPGVLSGWDCSPKTGMTVQIGGNGTVRDVAIAEDNAGNRTTVNNRTATPIEITLTGSPATGNRRDTIVGYVNNPQSGSGSSDVDFPSQVGIIAVSGTVAANPSYPTEAQIRTAITADGADGTTAYYVPLADIYVGQGVSTIGSGVIEKATMATMTAADVSDGAITTDKVANVAITGPKLDLSTVAPLLFKTTTMAAISYTTISTAWSATNIGSAVNITGLDAARSYVVVATTAYVESSGGEGEFRLSAAGATTVQTSNYSDGNLQSVSYTLPPVKPDSSGKIVLQRIYAGTAGQIRTEVLNVLLITVA